ncbi:MAG TPA: radical SAM family heme chaperone HemW [Terriglobales bacterium]|nr:radical SAM family heme chaperone HemW [Terriglobales bacterium]
MPLGLYISVPFCRTKCSYCNFASDVFSRAIFQRYIDRVCSDLARSAEITEQMGAVFERFVDSVYLGGGTPTVLDIGELRRLFVTISQNFDVPPGAEITVECAPGTLTPAMLDLFQRQGINRVSLGVQSFVDQESRSVGRLHTRATVFHDIARLRAAGIENINVDLIAGLPHQTVESWNTSVSQAIDSGVPHVSIYMLEVDEDSRLGRELIAGGTRYHAHFVPDEDLIADLYEIACERLDSAGVHQYEISNFARKGYASRHNLKYWTRQPYLGFGVDAHSMLPTKVGIEAQNRPLPLSFREGFSECVRTDFLGNHVESNHRIPAPKGRNVIARHVTAGWMWESEVSPGGTTEFSRTPFSPRGTCFANSSPMGPTEAVRFSTPDSLDKFLSGDRIQRIPISPAAALEETFFLGLRLNRGVDLSKLTASFGSDAVAAFSPAISDFVQQGLLERDGETIRLTSRGRLLSNEVFATFLAA